MSFPWQTIEGFAGASGVGALCFLGIFLFLDGRAPNLYPTVEFFAKTTTWSIVAAIPVLAIIYVIGLLAMNGGELIVDRISKSQAVQEIPDLVTIGEHDKSAITQQYLKLRQEKEILSGSFIALILLTIGAFSEISNLPSLKAVIIIAAIGSFVIALGFLWLAISKGVEAHSLAEAIKSLPQTTIPSP